MSHSFAEFILHFNLCSAYLGGDFIVSFRVNSGPKILLTYLIAFLMATAVWPVQI